MVFTARDNSQHFLAQLTIFKETAVITIRNHNIDALPTSTVHSRMLMTQ